MEFEDRDTEVVQLLGLIKRADREYPEELLTVRRQQFVNQLAELAAFAGAGTGLRSVMSTTRSSLTGGLVEALLVIAIVAEAGALAFINRDKLAEFFWSASEQPATAEVSSPPVIDSLPADSSSTGFIEITATITASATPSPTLYAATSTAANGDILPEATVQMTTTPDPNGNNGNHYGQTPKPERTKESGNDKKPKEPKPTKKPKGK